MISNPAERARGGQFDRTVQVAERKPHHQVRAQRAADAVGGHRSLTKDGPEDHCDRKAEEQRGNEMEGHGQGHARQVRHDVPGPESDQGGYSQSQGQRTATPFRVDGPKPSDKYAGERHVGHDPRRDRAAQRGGCDDQQEQDDEQDHEPFSPKPAHVLGPPPSGVHRQPRGGDSGNEPPGMMYRARTTVTLSLPPASRAMSIRVWTASCEVSMPLSASAIWSSDTMSFSPSVHSSNRSPSVN